MATPFTPAISTNLRDALVLARDAYIDRAKITVKSLAKEHMQNRLNEVFDASTKGESIIDQRFNADLGIIVTLGHTIDSMNSILGHSTDKRPQNLANALLTYMEFGINENSDIASYIPIANRPSSAPASGRNLSARLILDNYQNEFRDLFQETMQHIPYREKILLNQRYEAIAQEMEWASPVRHR